MKRHWSYLKYLIRHKWFVLVASRKVRGCPLWRAIIHDWSKFLPGEWSAYASTFYRNDGTGRYKESDHFDHAWLYHQHRNRHHWQYWVLSQDDGHEKCLRMPYKYACEMVADWMGAGRAITGKWEVVEWYEKNKDRINLEGSTRRDIEAIILKV